MKFSIVTPTYKRRDHLERAVTSLINQTYKDWEMIIINDSPFDDTYSSFVVNDSRVRYYKNEHNKGVNFSRNRALDLLGADSEWVIFLDDDDYLAPDTLAMLHTTILINQHIRWFMTNRALKNGTPLTETKYGEREYQYARDYLLLKRIKGDATHCLQTKMLHEQSIRFSNAIKQGEEWLFFFQCGMYTPLLYRDHNSTITDGYDTASGLNFRKRTAREYLKTTLTLYKEGINRAITSPYFFLYLTLRIAHFLIKR